MKSDVIRCEASQRPTPWQYFFCDGRVVVDISYSFDYLCKCIIVSISFYLSLYLSIYLAIYLSLLLTVVFVVVVAAASFQFKSNLNLSGKGERVKRWMLLSDWSTWSTGSPIRHSFLSCCCCCCCCCCGCRCCRCCCCCCYHFCPQRNLQFHGGL